MATYLMPIIDPDTLKGVWEDHGPTIMSKLEEYAEKYRMYGAIACVLALCAKGMTRPAMQQLKSQLPLIRRHFPVQAACLENYVSSYFSIDDSNGHQTASLQGDGTANGDAGPATTKLVTITASPVSAKTPPADPAALKTTQAEILESCTAVLHTLQNELASSVLLAFCVANVTACAIQCASVVLVETMFLSAAEYNTRVHEHDSDLKALQIEIDGLKTGILAFQSEYTGDEDDKEALKRLCYNVIDSWEKINSRLAMILRTLAKDDKNLAVKDNTLGHIQIGLFSIAALSAVMGATTYVAMDAHLAAEHAPKMRQHAKNAVKCSLLGSVGTAIYSFFRIRARRADFQEQLAKVADQQQRAERLQAAFKITDLIETMLV